MFVRNKWVLSLFILAKRKGYVLQDCPFSSQRLKQRVQQPALRIPSSQGLPSPLYRAELL